MRFKLSLSPLSAILRGQKRLKRTLEQAMPKFRPVVEPTKTPRPRSSRSSLVQVHAFGSNPGRLTMLECAPPHRSEPQTLVVVLHGCLQTARQFDRGSGWSRMAREKGFVLLCPEQRKENNQNLCFNWFRPSMVAHDRGELMSIRQMIEHAIQRHGIDRGRVFIQGLSAGGAMANALLVTYPGLFAAGQVIGGLPYGAARDAMTAFSVMKSGAKRSAAEWGNLARGAARDVVQRMPAISIWQGRADTVVAPANAESLLVQWLDLHGLDKNACETRTDLADEAVVWRDASGKVLVDYRVLDGLEHGLPVMTRRAAAARQPYMIEGAVGAPEEFYETFIRPR